MTDKELLELAANACNWVLEDDDDEGLSWIVWGDNNVPMDGWNPITDDGDALRLAVKLRMDLKIEFDRIDAYAESNYAVEYLYDLPSPSDPYAATRRAIVRAAAEIGKTL